MLQDLEFIRVTSSNTQERNSTKDYVRIYQLFMQNKPNLRNDILNVNLFTTKVYEENGHSGHEKTKPIQTQFKPIKAKINPIKAKTNPIQTQFQKVNGLDNNLRNCYINLSEFLYGQIVKIGKRNI